MRLRRQSGTGKKFPEISTEAILHAIPERLRNSGVNHKQHTVKIVDAHQRAGFASNGYGAHSPGGYSLVACLVAEIVLTFMFLVIILGATDRRAPQGFAPIAIGLGLTLIHLIGIPVTNLWVNPARSTGPAVFVGGWALQQLWLFWIAPLVGRRSRALLILLWRGNRKPSRRFPGLAPLELEVRRIWRYRAVSS